MALEYNSDLGYWYGRVWSQPLSAALFDNENIYVLELVNGSYLFPQIQPGDNISVYWSNTSDPNYFLFEILWDDQNQLWYINSTPNSAIPYESTFDGLSYPLGINVAFNPTDEVAYNASLYMALNGVVFAQVDFYGEGRTEDERFTTWLSNFGIKFNREDALIIADYDIKEAMPDWQIINQKRKELITNQEEIFPYIGTYRGVSNIINIMGFNNIMRLKEYWTNVDPNSAYFNKFLLTDVTDVMNAGTVALVDPDQINKDIKFSPSFRKTGFLALAYEFMVDTGTVDIDGVPITEYTTDFTFSEIFFKMNGMKRKLENEFLPANVLIRDIIGEFLYFTKIVWRGWTDSTPILESFKASKISIGVQPGAPMNIRELKPLYDKTYPNGISFPQYNFNATGVELFSNNQKYAYSDMPGMVEAFNAYYAAIADNTTATYEEDTRPWEMGDDHETPVGCPAIFTLQTDGPTIGDMSGVNINDMMFGFATVPNNDGSVTIYPHAGYQATEPVTYTLTYVKAGGSPSVTMENQTGVFTGIPVSDMTVTATEADGTVWTVELAMEDYHEDRLHTIVMDGVTGFDLVVKDNTTSPAVNSDGMIWLSPVTGYDGGVQIVYQISYEYDDSPVYVTQVGNGLFTGIPASDVTITITDVNGEYYGLAQVNVGTIASQWQVAGYADNYEVSVKNCTQVPLTPHTFANIEFLNMYEVEWFIEKDSNPTYYWNYRGPINRTNPWNGKIESLVSIAHVLPYVGNYVIKAYAYDYMGGVSMKFETSLSTVATTIPHIVSLMRLDDKFDFHISNMSNVLLSDLSVTRWYDMRINVLGNDSVDARIKTCLLGWDFYSNTKDGVKIYDESYSQLGFTVTGAYPGAIIRFLDITNNDTSTIDYVIPSLSPFTLSGLAAAMNASTNSVISKFLYVAKNGSISAAAKNRFADSYYGITMLDPDGGVSSVMTGSSTTYAFTTAFLDYNDSLNSAKKNWLTAYGTSNSLSDYAGMTINEAYFLRGSDTVYSSNFLAGFEIVNPTPGHVLRFNAYYDSSGNRYGYYDYIVPTFASAEDLANQMSADEHPVLSLFNYSVVSGNVRAASKEFTDLAYQFIDHVYSTSVDPIPGSSFMIPVGVKYTIPDDIPLNIDALATYLNTQGIGMAFSPSGINLGFTISSAAGYWYAASVMTPEQGDPIPVPVTGTFSIPYGTPTDPIEAAEYLNTLPASIGVPTWAMFISNMGGLYMVNQPGAGFTFSMQLTEYSYKTAITYPVLGYSRIPDAAPRDPESLSIWLSANWESMPAVFGLNLSVNASPSGIKVEADNTKVSYEFGYVGTDDQLIGLNAYIYAPRFSLVTIPAATALDVNMLVAILSDSPDPALADMEFSAVDGNLVVSSSYGSYFYEMTYYDVTFGDQIQCMLFEDYTLPSISPATADGYAAFLNANTEADPGLAAMRFASVDGVVVCTGLNGDAAPSPMGGSDYTFFEPVWAYSPDFIIHVESQRDAYGHRLYPNFRPELMFLLCPFSDILSGAANDPAYFYAGKYLIWDSVNNVLNGSLPSVLDRDTFALDSLKIRSNAYCAPKFCTLFFALNNLSDTGAFVWSVYESDSGVLFGSVSDVPFLAWRFDAAGTYDIAVQVTDNEGNVFTDRIERFVTIMEPTDYISYVENLLNVRKSSINNSV